MRRGESKEGVVVVDMRIQRVKGMGGSMKGENKKEGEWLRG